MPAPRFTLDQLRALVTVVDQGGYARAAHALHKSQSTVTYAVQQLESQLGVEVFRLEGRRARLTSTGELLYRRARYLLEEAAGLERSARLLSAGWEARIGLAAEVVFPTRLLLACLDRFGRESPNTRIELIESVLGHRTDALASGEADLAIFGEVPAGFWGEPLMRVRFVLAAHPAHPLHRLGRPVSMRDLRAHRHLVVRESSRERGSPTSLDVTQRWTVSHLSTSIEAVRAGFGFAWLPEEHIREALNEGTLARLPLGEGAERFAELYLVYADHENAGPGVRRLAEILAEEVDARSLGAARARGRGVSLPAPRATVPAPSSPPREPPRRSP